MITASDIAERHTLMLGDSAVSVAIDPDGSVGVNVHAPDGTSVVMFDIETWRTVAAFVEKSLEVTAG